ncbi:tetratricopeptide repeat protein [Desulfatiferula olefinivorans]
MKTERLADRLKRASGLVLVLAVTVLVYQGVLSSDFISMDDPVYVTDNPFVNRGFSRDGIRWAFDFGHESGPYWMPVTMLSHMADVHLFGLDPSMHHGHNLILHLLNVLLLSTFFMKVSGDYSKSLLIAALFALHPLNVESVAWVTSRKNVLSTVFWLSAMLAYLRYLTRKDLVSYLMVFVCFVLGLMAKASVITLIFSLLLLDIWPFHRFLLFREGGTTRYRLRTLMNLTPVLEKIPFLVFTGLVLYVNFTKTSFVGEATTLDAVPMAVRLSNAVSAYGVYLVQMIWPVGLSVHYPYPESISLWKTLPTLALLVTVTGAVLWQARLRPFLMVGWFWFIGNLVMVSGLIQGGLWPAHADRFMYVPMIGLLTALAWAGGQRPPTRPFVVTAAAVCLCLAVLTWIQVGHWKDGIRLYRHALAVNPDDRASLVNLAFALDKAGKGAEAVPHYQAILEYYPHYAEVHVNLGVILAGQGRDTEALVHFERAMALKPSLESAVQNAAVIYEKHGRIDDAVAAGEILWSRQPDNMKRLSALTRLLVDNGRLKRAAEVYEKALTVLPGARVSLCYNLACVYAMDGQTDRAMDYLNRALAAGFNRRDLLARDEQLDRLRSLPEFKRLLEGTP